jgi:hypothetical protein
MRPTYEIGFRILRGFFAQGFALMHLMVVAGLVAAFNPSVTPLSHHPEMRRGSGAVATIALGKPDEPLVSVPPQR